MYYVYLLECTDDKSWYIGYSADLRQRIERHKKRDGARTTKRKQHWELIYYEAYKNEQDAKGRERFLKSGSGRRYLKKQLRHYLGNILRNCIRPHTNCTGTPHTPSLPLYPFGYGRNGPHFYKSINTQSVPNSYLSRYDNGGICIIGDGGLQGGATEIEEIPAPLTLPLAWPPEVR